MNIGTRHNAIWIIAAAVAVLAAIACNLRAEQVTVEWDGQSGESYTVWWNNGNMSYPRTASAGTNRFYTIKYLRHGSRYFVAVQAHNVEGSSFYCRPIVVDIPQPEPPPFPEPPKDEFEPENRA